MNQRRAEKLDPRFADFLLESMADGVFTLDDKGKITLWNRSMEKITGYSAGEVLGKDCRILNFNRCFQKPCPTGVAECGIYKYGKVDAKECMLIHRDGHAVPVLKSARIVKNKDGSKLGIVETVTDLTELKTAQKKMEDAAFRLGEVYSVDNIIGKSHAMKQVFSAIKAAAASDATVLIQGQSGTGKELVASAIHHNSERSDMPFVTVNCSALSESVLESELFGHAKGAFTGAIKDRAGRFEEASGGTIFLDEIGDISPFIQVKLLRVIQEREIERVGESSKRNIDIRIITATNKDLMNLVRQGMFREDLYYRLKVFPIPLPPLIHRKEDIPLLIERFIALQNQRTGKHIRGISQDAMRILMDYDFPGNVRELENAIEHAFVLCTNAVIDLFDLPVEIRQVGYRSHTNHPAASTMQSPNLTKKKKLTKEALLDLLDACDWNKAEVARQVGLSRTAVWKYMKKWNIPLQKS